MRAVVQRVSEGSIQVEDQPKQIMGPGLVALVAVSPEDTQKDLDYIRSKIVNLRIFEDDDGKMNRSVKDTGGQILIVSQFTLYGDCRKGRRPSFIRSGKPEEAEPIYNRFVQDFEDEPVEVLTGEFQSNMKVGLVNDGPVTILLDSEKVF